MSLFNTTRLLNKTVLITGASSGIGAATAVLFAKGGSNLVLLARRADALKRVADACVDAHKGSGVQGGGKVALVQIDISDKAQVNGVLDKIPDELRSIDVLVNNAGYVLGTERIGQISTVDMEGMFSTNVFGLINMTQTFVNDMKTRNTGHVINIGSIAGREPYVGGSVYCATKHAVRAFSGALLRELVETQIRVTEIQPGMVETEFSLVRYRGDKEAAENVYKNFTPLSAGDIAEEIVWAASRPPHVNIAEVFIMPTNQATPCLVHRGNK